MKIKKLNILLAVSFGALIAFSSCSKDDGPIPSRVTITDVPAISTNIDPAGSQSILLSNLAAFAGKFTVSLYFAGATPPTKIDIVIRKSNGTTVNNNNVKLYKAGITTFPTSYTVTAAEIAAIFGTPLVLNDNYDFAPNIFLGDRKLEAFPLIGSGTGAGVRAMPLFSEFTRFTVK